MRKKSLLCFIVALVMLLGIALPACKGNPSGPQTDKYTVSAEDALKYEQNLTWGREGHLYIHYLRGAHSEKEHGTVNSATAPAYSTQISSEVYGDWGLWVWEYFPTNSEGRAFYPMKIDESGAVYDIDLTATYNDGGWDEANRTSKTLEINYSQALRMGIQVYSQDSRINGRASG